MAVDSAIHHEITHETFVSREVAENPATPVDENEAGSTASMPTGRTISQVHFVIRPANRFVFDIARGQLQRDGRRASTRTFRAFCGRQCFKGFAAAGIKNFEKLLRMR